MPTKSIDRLYDQFSPPERVTLMIEAMARQDETEQERLRLSCPRKNYSSTDHAFTDKLEFLYDLTLIVAGDLRWHLGKLWIAELAREMGPKLTERHALGARVSFHEGFLLGRGKPSMDLLRYCDKEQGEVLDRTKVEAVDPQEYEDDPYPLSEAEAKRYDIPEQYIKHADGFYKRLWTPTIDRMAADFKSVWMGFEQFTTKELNLDPLVVMEAFCPPIAEQVRVGLLRYAKIKPDAGAVKEYVEGMMEAWGRVSGKSG